MNKPTFFAGVGAALAFALVAGAAFAALGPIWGSTDVLRGLIAALGLAYLLFLLRSAKEKIGRVTSVTAWLVCTILLWWTSPPMGIYLLVQVAMIWLIRSLYFYSSLFAALADLGLSSFSVAAAIWAASRSGSVSLTVWTFFLVQALFVFIPRVLPKAKETNASGGLHDDEDPFQRAQRSAEAALRRLSLNA